ncbi:MAG: carbon storage regulator [Clostridia bacterium]|jgi:carbon storage regulator|nr:carbon storage regulator [Clostridiaceae bacterium]
MLVLSRKKGQYIIIGENIKVTILDVGEDRVSIGIDAPREINIIRGELLEETKQTNLEAVSSSLSALNGLKKVEDKKDN